MSIPPEYGEPNDPASSHRAYREAIHAYSVSDVELTYRLYRMLPENPIPESVRRERVQMIIDAINAHPDHFDMYSFANVRKPSAVTGPNGDPRYSLPFSQFTEACGTVMCIAGWAVAISQPQGYPFPDIATSDHDADTDFEGVARDWLGLSRGQAHDLFFAYGLTVETASDVLRNYAETGEVDVSFLENEDD